MSLQREPQAIQQGMPPVPIGHSGGRRLALRHCHCPDKRMSLWFHRNTSRMSLPAPIVGRTMRTTCLVILLSPQGRETQHSPPRGGQPDPAWSAASAHHAHAWISWVWVITHSAWSSGDSSPVSPFDIVLSRVPL